jgi:hypothetical protein
MDNGRKTLEQRWEQQNAVWLSRFQTKQSLSQSETTACVGLTKEEEEQRTWDTKVEELKVLARLLAKRLNKPGENRKMQDLFWEEQNKNLGPEQGRKG